jgi:hypothetical protein
MGRHKVKDEDGKEYTWSDKDGDSDPEKHQTIYEETPSGRKEVKDKHYNPKDDSFHKK